VPSPFFNWCARRGDIAWLFDLGWTRAAELTPFRKNCMPVNETNRRIDETNKYLDDNNDPLNRLYEVVVRREEHEKLGDRVQSSWNGTSRNSNAASPPENPPKR
jgi:hypothetical protein